MGATTPSRPALFEATLQVVLQHLSSEFFLVQALSSHCERHPSTDTVVTRWLGHSLHLWIPLQKKSIITITLHSVRALFCAVTLAVGGVLLL